MPSAIHLGAHHRGKAISTLRSQHAIIEHPSGVNNAAQWHQRGAAIEQRLDGCCIGNIGFHHLHRRPRVGELGQHGTLGSGGHTATPRQHKLTRAVRHQLLGHL